MHPSCPYCSLSPNLLSGIRKVIRSGHFYRKSDGKWIQRFSCRECSRHFSHATQKYEFRQNKRHLNNQVFRLLSSGISMRRLAIVLGINRLTVSRKLIFLAQKARMTLANHHRSSPKATVIEFDDIESFEHTKCKPLSITMVVQHGSRRILGFKVSQMPAKGKLAAISKKKYGKRADHRPQARRALFKEIEPLIEEGALIKSDQSPHYPNDVKEFFPKSEHQTFKGRRGCSTGYGELKKGKFDPLFSFNHTAACFRDSVKRLARRTWCTTKKKERLADHLTLYALFHNQILLSK